MGCKTLAADLIVDARSMVGEGPVWDSTQQKLIWVDIAPGLIHALDPQSLAVSTRQAGQPVGAVALGSGGQLVVALRDGFGILPAVGEGMNAFIEVEAAVAGNRMNDGKCDCRGRFWAGSMAMDHTPGAGTLYRLVYKDGHLEASAQLEGITIANGLDWSTDNARMYYIDSATQRIDMFDFDPEAGQLSNRRVFVAIPRSEGLPDGMVIDAEGFVWVALFGAGKVRRYSPSGEIDMEVHVPVTLVTSCAFGGEHLQDLYITTARHRLTATEAMGQPTAGALFACRPGPTGRLPFVFGG